MKRILLVGGGGREQALAWKLAQSVQVERIYVAPGNGGSQGVIENVDIHFTDAAKLLEFAQQNSIDLTVIGQEASSEAGVVDAFRAAGLTVFGPTKGAVAIEASKAQSKKLMTSEKIPTAHYQTFTDTTAALAYAENHPLPLVIKADGLAGGKGVSVCTTTAEVSTAIRATMVEKKFGSAGDTIVIEDFLQGQEVSVHALCDGTRAVLFPSSQDHKQIYDGDKGPNTGGVGAFAPVPWVTPKHMGVVHKQVVQPALNGLAKADTPFTGCLYPGLMIDGDAVNVVEFNARFGDPEAEVYMRLLDGDLFAILCDCANGRLDPASITWKPGFAVSVVLCSGGYPLEYKTGLPITGIEESEKLEDIVIFHSFTKLHNNQLVTNGGRVLNVTATGATLDEAIRKAYAAIECIHFEGMYYRTDIGKRPAPKSAA